jgi:Leucine Rich Repeat (LRR) protein
MSNIMANIINGIVNTVKSWWNKPVQPVQPVASLTDLAIAAVAKNYENIGTPHAVASIEHWDSVTWFVNEESSVGQKIKSIEAEVAASKPDGIDAAWWMKSQVMTMFQKLKEAFPIPLTDLAKVQDWEDEALVKIYGFISTYEKYQGFPILNTPKEIKAFLHDPANLHLLSQVRFIYLKKAGLKAIPPELKLFPNLFSLNLQTNEIQFIPEWIGDLKQLYTLDLWSNQIKVIPESIGKLTNLHELTLNNNQISVIPDCLGNLKKLTTLWIGHNQIRVIPDTLKNLQKLHCLGLNYNKIEVIPEWVGNTTQDVMYLSHVYLYDNQIRAIPECIKNRYYFRFEVYNNKITYIPDWFVDKHYGYTYHGLNMQNGRISYTSNYESYYSTFASEGPCHGNPDVRRDLQVYNQII